MKATREAARLTRDSAASLSRPTEPVSRQAAVLSAMVTTAARIDNWIGRRRRESVMQSFYFGSPEADRVLFSKRLCSNDGLFGSSQQAILNSQLKGAVLEHHTGAIMTRVNLDIQPEVVRQFVLALSSSEEGAVLESGGRPVACVVPPPKPNGPDIPEEAWTEEKNRRRGELIDRKYEHGLSPTEEAELALLQDALDRTLDRVAPLPLDAARRLHQELLQKAVRGQDANPA